MALGRRKHLQLAVGERPNLRIKLVNLVARRVCCPLASRCKQALEQCFPVRLSRWKVAFQVETRFVFAEFLHRVRPKRLLSHLLNGF